MLSQRNFSLPFSRVPARAATTQQFVYFARPDSRVFGAMVDTVRQLCGVELAREAPVPRVKDDEKEVVRCARVSRTFCERFCVLCANFS